MNRLTLITGGAKSGKSDFALEHAEGLGARRAFIATAQALDAEMRVRIEAHQKERGEDWVTVEEPLAVAQWLADNASKYDVVLVDCLTLWLSNTMFSDCDAEAESIELTDAMSGAACNVVAVTNEVGMGIVPGSSVGREFRDLAGRLNQLVAREADEVYLVVSGIPVRIKPGPQDK